MVKHYPRLAHASQYRWLFLLTILLTLVALLPISQSAQRQSQESQPPQGRRSLLLQGPAKPTKKARLDAVPGEILVRFRPDSSGKRLGRQLVTSRTGRQIALAVRAIGPGPEIVDGLRVGQVNPAD